MKVLKNIVVTIVGIVFVLGLAVLGTQIYFRKRHNVDLFATISNFKTMSQEVDESTVCPNAYDKADQEGAKESANSSINDLVTYDETTEKYSVNFEGLTTMTRAIDFTDKQLAAFAQMMVEKQMDGKLKINDDLSLNFCVRQIKISDVQEDGSATFNVVVKFDLTTIKDKMSSFPMSLIKKYVPDSLYISSTVYVKTVEGNSFGYTIESKELIINNLTNEGTKEVFEALDCFLQVGTSDNLNKQIGETVMDVLVGEKDNADKKGLAVSLSTLGANGYKFYEKDSVGHFVITMQGSTTRDTSSAENA